MKPTILIQLSIFLTLIIFASNALTNEKHVVLESDDEGEIIFFPEQMEEGPDGNLYVLDSGDSFIKVFSSSGEFLNKLGGGGAGPGEFQRTDGATFGFTVNEKLFFTEYFGGHRWITVMELHGEKVNVLSPQLDVMFGVEGAFSLSEGGFLVQLSYNTVPRPKGDYFLYDKPQSLVRMDSLGTVVSEIAKTNYTKMISYSSNGATSNLPFVPVFVWAAIGKNEVVWSDGMSNRLLVLDYSGQRVREITTPLPHPKQVPEADLQQWKRNREERLKSWDPVWWGRFGKVIHEYKKPLYDKPIIREISTTPAGNLLVEGQTYSDSGESIYWLLDRQGKHLKSITVAAEKVHFTDNFVLFVTYDEDENPSVHAIKHFGDEVTTMSEIVNSTPKTDSH